MLGVKNITDKIIRLGVIIIKLYNWCRATNLFLQVSVCNHEVLMQMHMGLYKYVRVNMYYSFHHYFFFYENLILCILTEF